MTFFEKLAVGMMIGSWVVTTPILLLPFVELPYNRVVVGVGIYVFSQVIFWVGAAIGGRELVRRYRERFPWLSWTPWSSRKS